mmetsp:Transcript_19438/g.62379  ORF Transcript_19438/g.62379 Transcript_19438/m.62379 type:complete len:295 (-) Transcript_19438:363-1247(-)
MNRSTRHLSRKGGFLSQSESFIERKRDPLRSKRSLLAGVGHVPHAGGGDGLGGVDELDFFFFLRLLLADAELGGAEDGVDLFARGELEVDLSVENFDGESDEFEVAVELLAVAEAELLLVEGARDLGLVAGEADDALGEDEGLLVGAHVLGGEPGIVVRPEDGELRLAVEDGRADVRRKVRRGAEGDPGLDGPLEDGGGIIIFLGGGGTPVRLGRAVVGPHDGPLLAGLGVVRKVHDFLGVVGIRELLEPLLEGGVLDDDGPFVVVGVDDVLHAGLEFVVDPQRVVYDDVLERL